MIFLILLLGVIIGAVIMFYIFPKTRRRHIDYKKRWEDAISLLESQGTLTEAQIRQLKPAKGKASSKPSSIHHQMASWDRKKVAITRARQGLPPDDDLKGMASWDIQAVLEARAKGERK